MFDRYRVDYLGHVKSEEWGGVYVDIDNVLHRKMAGWQVDTKTFTTRVGGVIGVGKNLLWVVMLSVTSIVTLFNLTRKYFKMKKDFPNIAIFP